MLSKTIKWIHGFLPLILIDTSRFSIHTYNESYIYDIQEILTFTSTRVQADVHLKCWQNSGLSYLGHIENDSFDRNKKRCSSIVKGMWQTNWKLLSC